MKKLKIIFSLLTCFIIVFSLSACSGTAQKDKVVPENLTELIETSILQYPAKNEQFRYNVYNNYVEITKCLTAASVVEIPDKIGKLPVIGIRESAFMDNENIQELIITDNLRFIREEAFKNCENLKTVKMSEGLMELDKSAFLDCISLKEINLPSSLKYIESKAFEGCTNLEKVIIDGSSDPAVLEKKANGYRVIEASAFSDCPYLKHVWISNDISEINKTSFKNSIEHLTIYGYAASSAARFAADNLIDFEEKDKYSFYNTMTTSTGVNIPHYKTFGEPISSKNWNIELVESKEYKAINNYKVEKGKIYLALTFKITNKSSQTQYFNYLNTKAKVSGFSKYPILLDAPKINNSNYLSFSVEQGETKTGYLLYEVNENWKYISVDFGDCAGFTDKGNIETCLMVKH